MQESAQRNTKPSSALNLMWSCPTYMNGSRATTKNAEIPPSVSVRESVRVPRCTTRGEAQLTGKATCGMQNISMTLNQENTESSSSATVLSWSIGIGILTVA